MTTAESMALAVLKGDLLAARALADHLINETQDGRTLVIPIQKITVPVDRLRVVLYLKRDGPLSQQDRVASTLAIERWLRGEGGPLFCQGIDRIEIYELPPTEILPVSEIQVAEQERCQATTVDGGRRCVFPEGHRGLHQWQRTPMARDHQLNI